MAARVRVSGHEPPSKASSIRGLLKGSWDLVTRVIIRVNILITPIKVLITLLTKSHDPPSKATWIPRPSEIRGLRQVLL